MSCIIQPFKYKCFEHKKNKQINLKDLIEEKKIDLKFKLQIFNLKKNTTLEHIYHISFKNNRDYIVYFYQTLQLSLIKDNFIVDKHIKVLDIHSRLRLLCNTNNLKNIDKIFFFVVHLYCFIISFLCRNKEYTFFNIFPYQLRILFKDFDHFDFNLFKNNKEFIYFMENIIKYKNNLYYFHVKPNQKKKKSFFNWIDLYIHVLIIFYMLIYLKKPSQEIFNVKKILVFIENRFNFYILLSLQNISYVFILFLNNYQILDLT